MALSFPRLYPVTDLRFGDLSHSKQVERLARGGATLVQVREKSLSPLDFYTAAAEAVSLARRLGVRVIINDRVDIALAVGANGVHVGQGDLPPARVRALLGPKRVIGFSTHSLEQAVAADSMPVDYIAIGPIYRTATKENPDPIVGLELISEVARRVSKPIVAIGGITLDRAPSVIAAGADSVAVIADLHATGDLTARTRQFLDRLS